MTKSFQPMLCLTLLVGSLTLVITQLVSLYRIDEQNSWIAQLALGKDISLDKLVNSAPEVRLARALYLKKRHRYDDALATLSLIMEQGDRQLQAKIRYNLGNIYLEQVVSKVERMAINEALPLAALAKQAYRQALTLDSQFWDAKYNLEVAMRLLPEMDRIDSGDDPVHTPKTQLWTTVPGFPRGLP